MKLNYTVSDENYLETLKKEMQRNRTPRERKLQLFFLTVGQMIFFVIFSFAFLHTTGSRLAALLFSLAIAVGAIVSRANFGKKAAATLARMKKESIPPAFWQPHQLTLANGELSVSYAKTTEKYACRTITAVAPGDGVLTLRTNKKIVEIIPLTAFEDGKNGVAREDFERELEAQRLASRQDFLRMQREAIPPETVCRLDYTYDRERYLLDQRSAQRNVYRTLGGWSFTLLAKLALSVATIWYIAAHFSVMALLCGIVIVLILNLEFLYTYTPLVDKKLAERMDAVYPDRSAGGAVTFYATKTKFVAIGEYYFLQLASPDIKVAYLTARCVALYTKRQDFITIPLDAFESEEQAGRFVLFVNACVRGNGKDDPMDALLDV